jgi:hypothetical protein
MVKRKPQDTYFSRTKDVPNQKLNISLRAQEKVYDNYEIANTREPEPTYQNMTAPTTNPSRPRALKLAYSKEAQKLVVKFRDNTWWEYNEIPVDFWNYIKSSPSTGKALSNTDGLGLDSWHNMGKFDPEEMSPETRVLFNS